MKLKKPSAPSAKSAVLPTLEKGQLWKTEKGHVEIMEVGKTLTHYRLYQSQKRVPTSLGRIQMVQDYLKNNQAKLVKNDRLNRPSCQGLRSKAPDLRLVVGKGILPQHWVVLQPLWG